MAGDRPAQFLQNPKGTSFDHRPEPGDRRFSWTNGGAFSDDGGGIVAIHLSAFDNQLSAFDNQPDDTDNDGGFGHDHRSPCSLFIWTSGIFAGGPDIRAPRVDSYLQPLHIMVGDLCIDRRRLAISGWLPLDYVLASGIYCLSRTNYAEVVANRFVSRPN